MNWYEKLVQFHNKRRLGNRGSATVMVLVAMGLIGVLAATIVWMSFTNYKIKISDKRNKESFYSAETVTEQMMAGIENLTSAAITVAYQDVMKNWDADEYEANREERFAKSFAKNLKESLQDSSVATGYYDVDLLKSFVDPLLYGDIKTKWDVTSTASENQYSFNAAAELGANKLDTDGGTIPSEIILRNISVYYTDDNNFVSIINTDIAIAVPHLVFYQPGDVSNLYSYAILADEGVNVRAGISKVEGSIYAGAVEDDTNPERPKFDGGIMVNTGASLSVSKAEHVISGADISVKGPSSGFSVTRMSEGSNDIYARSLLANSGQISLQGRTYLSNDINLKGTGSRVSLQSALYAYGNSITNPDESSAIIVNGTNSTIDMEKVTSLVIAGRAYIGLENEKKEGTGTDTSVPNMMGESIAVKGGQIAYLVPPEAIGVVVDEALAHKTQVGVNPLNLEVRNKLEEVKTECASKGLEFREVDFDKPIYRLNNQPLNKYITIAPGKTWKDYIQKVTVQYPNGDTRNKSLTYYYIKFEDKETAKKYFQDYYANKDNKETMDLYFNKYATGGIHIGNPEDEDISYTLLGNAMVNSLIKPDEVTLISGEKPTETITPSTEPADGLYHENYNSAEYVNNAMTEEEVAALSTKYTNRFEAYLSSLSESLNPGKTAVQTQIDIEFIRNGRSGEPAFYSNTDYPRTAGAYTFTTSDGLKAVITSEDYTVNDSKIRLVIGVGTDDSHKPDITVRGTFTGLVITEGEVNLEGAVIENNPKELAKVLAYKDDKGYGPLAFFMNGGGVLKNGTDEVNVEDIDLTEIVRYVNWVKK